ncbi:hypothetical protein QBC34DRAFT_179849 [Podospora aff. communis PSN243]|uniref:Uncharacterized protein n=1 Tax=Podospora aff. communis PSN243 TaxID=3040156 RepID=A0AAV9GBK5_9PEZI|nr:hypothetical protein QBC34DRAFT_179849 [Podospora aff. communis PSN243]
MRASSLLLSLFGGASLIAAVPVEEAPTDAPPVLEKRMLADLHERALNGSLDARQAANWALIGFTGTGCSGGLAFGYTHNGQASCTNTNFARSVGLTPGGAYTPFPRSASGCGGSAPAFSHAISANYYCYNGDVRSFYAPYTGGSPI